MPRGHCPTIRRAALNIVRYLVTYTRPAQGCEDSCRCMLAAATRETCRGPHLPAVSGPRFVLNRGPRFVLNRGPRRGPAGARLVDACTKGRYTVDTRVARAVLVFGCPNGTEISLHTYVLHICSTEMTGGSVSSHPVARADRGHAVP